MSKDELQGLEACAERTFLENIGFSPKEVAHMSRYETLLINLLQSIDQKLSRVIGLLEVSQSTENGGKNVGIKFIQVGDLPHHRHSEADMKALVDAIREILEEEAESGGSPKYE